MITALALFLISVLLLTMAGMVVVVRSHILRAWWLASVLAAGGLVIGGKAWLIWRQVFWLG